MVLLVFGAEHGCGRMSKADAAFQREARAGQAARAADDLPRVKEHVGGSQPFWNAILAPNDAIANPLAEWDAKYASLPASASTTVVVRDDALLIVDCDFRDFEDVVHHGAKLPVAVRGPVPSRHVNEFLTIDGYRLLRQRIYYTGDDAAAEKSLRNLFRWQRQ